MFQFPGNLRGTMILIRTIMICLSLMANQRGATLRTTRDKLDLRGIRHPLFHVYPNDLRDNLSPFLHVHHIMLMQIQLSNNILVMQRSPLHGSTRDMNRFQIRHRSNRTGTSHLVIHAKQSRFHPFRLKLISHSPTRRFRRVSQLQLLPDTIHLDHDPVNRYRKILPFHIPLVNKI